MLSQTVLLELARHALCIDTHMVSTYYDTNHLLAPKWQDYLNSSVTYTFNRKRNVNTRIKLRLLTYYAPGTWNTLIHYSNRAYEWILHVFGGLHYFSPYMSISNSHQSAKQALLNVVIICYWHDYKILLCYWPIAY